MLDLTRILSGPFSTMILADLGADVVKIEDTARGDDTRSRKASPEQAIALAGLRAVGNDVRMQRLRALLLLQAGP